MSNKEAFIEVVQELFDEKDLAEYLHDDETKAKMVLNYFEGLKGGKPDKLPVEITQNGIKILQFMQNNWEKFNNVFTSKIIAEGIFTSPRSVSGSMKKLIAGDFVDKIGGSPVSYAITDKGKEKELNG